MWRGRVLLIATTLAVSAIGRAGPGPAGPAAVTSASATIRPASSEAASAHPIGKALPEPKWKDLVHDLIAAADRKSVTTIELAALARRSVKTTWGVDLDAFNVELRVAFLMRQAEMQTQTEIKTSAAHVKAIDRAKGCQRDIECVEKLVREGEIPMEIADRAMDDIKNELDSLTEMGAMESHRLVVATDRLAKLMPFLTNLRLRMKEESSSISQTAK